MRGISRDLSLLSTFAQMQPTYHLGRLGMALGWMGLVGVVRAEFLRARNFEYVRAARALGVSNFKIMIRHVLPNTVAPLIVQGTFIVASAIIIEAILSFLGIGIPPEIPTWGNIMAEGREVFQLFPHNILYPGIVLALTVLSVNILGDGLRDTMDPRFAKRV